jgi:hypothetical protein
MPHYSPERKEAILQKMAPQRITGRRAECTVRK